MRSLILLLFFPIIITSCSKYDTKDIAPTQIISAQKDTSQSVKIDSIVINYFHKIENATSSEDKSNLKLVESSIIFDQKKEFQKNKQEILVAFDLKPINSSLKLTQNSVLIVSINNGVLITSKIASFLNPDNKNKDIAASILDYTFTNAAYTGTISVHTIAGKMLFSNKYLAGKLISHGLVIPKVLAGATKKTSGCTDWYLVTSSNGHVVSEQYLYSVCDCSGGDNQKSALSGDNAANRTNCGGDGGGGSPGSGSTGTPPANPEEGQEYSYVDKDGSTLMYRAHNGSWQFLGIMLPVAVIYGNIPKYPNLATDSPPENGYRVVENDGLWYTYLSNYGQWIGTYPNATSSVGNFVMSTSDQLLYPRFTDVVRNLPTFVDNSPVIMNALLQNTTRSAAQIKNDLAFNQGPTIKIEDLKNSSNPAYGKFNPATPNTLIIDKNFVAGLQYAKLPTTIQATSFLLAVTTLHEYVHYGNNTSGWYPPASVEQGELFEQAGFTIVVDKNNAYGLSVIFYPN